MTHVQGFLVGENEALDNRQKFFVFFAAAFIGAVVLLLGVVGRGDLLFSLTGCAFVLLGIVGAVSHARGKLRFICRAGLRANSKSVGTVLLLRFVLRGLALLIVLTRHAV